MHERRSPRRLPSRVSPGAASPGASGASASSSASVLRMLVLAIVALGLCSIALQGYGMRKQQPNAAAIQSEVARREAEEMAVHAASLLRKQKQEREDPHAQISALAGDESETIADKPHSPDACYDERDWGLVDKIKESAKVFCDDASAKESATKVTYFNVTRGGFRAVLFQRQFGLDLRYAKVNKPIKSMAEDGGRHDPRFVFHSEIVQCECEDLHQYAVDELTTNNRTLSIWNPMFAKIRRHTDPPSTVCAAGGAASYPMDGPHVEIEEKTLVIVRKDDHNPFFQISNALNGWILMHALGWKPEEVRVIHLDGGYPSPVDELHYKLLSPNYPVLKAIPEELQNHRLEFLNDVALVPYEVSGPMMQHLNDYEPCYDSKLLQDFKEEALRVMELPELPTKRKQITITVITRRNYGGRRVQRTWRNEAQILDRMRDLYPSYKDIPIVFNSVEFVGLTLQEQMWIMQSSDVVIGMHGAGMVNVLWTKPGTLIIEIFPKRRFRWGYRNLCQFLGCDWHQFRGGKDTGKGDNNSHKMIPWEEWADFFLPLFDNVLEQATGDDR